MLVHPAEKYPIPALEAYQCELSLSAGLHRSARPPFEKPRELDTQMTNSPLW